MPSPMAPSIAEARKAAGLGPAETHPPKNSCQAPAREQWAGRSHLLAGVARTPLAYTIDGACAASASGRNALYLALASGALVAHKRGRRTIILHSDLLAWLENLPKFVPAADKPEAGHGR
jgi:hypothetical protein